MNQKAIRYLLEVAFVLCIVAVVAAAAKTQQSLQVALPGDLTKLQSSVQDSFTTTVPFWTQTEKEEARLTQKLQAALETLIPGQAVVALEVKWDLPATIINSATRPTYSERCVRPIGKSSLKNCQALDQFPLVPAQIQVRIMVTNKVNPKQYQTLTNFCHQMLGLDTERGDSVSLMSNPLTN